MIPPEQPNSTNSRISKVEAALERLVQVVERADRANVESRIILTKSIESIAGELTRHAKEEERMHDVVLGTSSTPGLVEVVRQNSSVIRRIETIFWLGVSSLLLGGGAFLFHLFRTTKSV